MPLPIIDLTEAAGAKCADCSSHRLELQWLSPLPVCIRAEVRSAHGGTSRYQPEAIACSVARAMDGACTPDAKFWTKRRS